MDHHKLDSFLEEAKNQSERFFSNWNPRLHPHKIQAKSREGKSSPFLSRFGWKNLLTSWSSLLPSILYPAWPSRRKLGIIAAGLLLLLLASVDQMDFTRTLPAGSTSAPDDGFNQSSYASQQELLIRALPVGGYLVQGNLLFKDGILVKEAKTSLVPLGIPYQLNHYGELNLAAGQLLLQGEELLQVADNLPHSVELNAGDYYLLKVNERGAGFLLPATKFRIRHPGEDRLQFIPLSDPDQKRIIYVKVISEQ